MSTFLIGQRVNTSKYGPGTVIGFERVTHVNAPIQHPETYESGDRIQVALDTPSNWPGAKFTTHAPYFVPSDFV